MTIHRNRARTRLAALLALPILGLAIAGCSSGSSPSHGVANLPGGSAHGAGAPTLTQAQSDQDFVDFAHCMRAHGVQMPDPVHLRGHSGLSLVGLPAQTAANRPAFAACNHFIAQIEQMKNAHAQAVLGPLLPALTRYAECMRRHDIAMLDPTPQGQVDLGNVPGINNNFSRNSPQFHAADTACRHFLPASVQDDGTGP